MFSRTNLHLCILFFAFLFASCQVEEDGREDFDRQEPAFTNTSSSSYARQNRTNSDLIRSVKRMSNNTKPKKRDSDFVIVSGTSKAVCALGILCNLLLGLVIVFDPLEILHRGAWVTILYLSLADFLASVALFSKLLAFQTEDNRTRRKMTEKLDFFWMFGVGASFMLLTLLTLQMYMIIKYPVKSRLMITNKRVFVSCMMVWLIAACMGFGNIAYIWNKTMDVLYVYIANIAILEVAVALQVVVKILITVEISRSKMKLASATIHSLKQKEVAKTVVIMNVVLILTAFPYFLAKQIEYLQRLGHLDGNQLLRKFSYYYEPVALLNFVSNPLLYSLRLKDYRRSLVALFKFKCKKRRRITSLHFIRTSFTRTLK